MEKWLAGITELLQIVPARPENPELPLEEVIGSFTSTLSEMAIYRFYMNEMAVFTKCWWYIFVPGCSECSKFL
jgi:hypothetical protein